MDSKGVVIVAIPAQDDYVWRLSSEKVPHLTLLFLGELSAGVSLVRIAEHLEHVVSTSMCRFGLSVDRRGELGENKADVLYFNTYNLEKLLEFRTYLLRNTDISLAYNSAPQYPEWIPHLTMGYPETPAKKDDREYPGIHWVNFDRIALWTGDYEGPEFRLEDKYDEYRSLRMSDAGAEFLEHFGIKGMKWGVRRSRAQIDASPSSDHTSSRETQAKIKKGGVKAASNKELQELVTRMNLEQQYARIAPASGNQRAISAARTGGRFVGSVVASVGRTQAARVGNHYSAQYINRAFGISGGS